MQSEAMMYISELLPNPAGKDAEGEWIEICVAGSESQNLAGWKLQNTKGKTFVFPDETLEPYQCVAFEYAQTKLTITNTGGTFYLVNPSGEITDSAIYEGTYKDDVSAIRINPTSAFVMSMTPTKGYANVYTKSEAVLKKIPRAIYEAKIASTTIQEKREVIYEGPAYGEIVLAGVFLAGILTALFWYACKKIVLHTRER